MEQESELRNQLTSYFEQWVEKTANMVITMNEIFKKSKNSETKIEDIKKCLEIGKKKMEEFFEISNTSLIKIFQMEDIPKPEKELSSSFKEKIKKLSLDLHPYLQPNEVETTTNLMRSKKIFDKLEIEEIKKSGLSQSKVLSFKAIESEEESESDDSSMKQYSEDDEFLEFFNPDNLRKSRKIPSNSVSIGKKLTPAAVVKMKDSCTFNTNEIFEKICEKQGLLSPSNPSKNSSSPKRSKINLKLKSLGSSSQCTGTEEYNIYGSKKSSIVSKPPLYQKNFSKKNLTENQKLRNRKMISSSVFPQKFLKENKENVKNKSMESSFCPRRILTSRPLTESFHSTPTLRKKILKTKTFHTREYLFKNLQGSDMNFKIEELSGLNKGKKNKN